MFSCTISGLFLIGLVAASGCLPRVSNHFQPHPREFDLIVEIAGPRLIKHRLCRIFGEFLRRFRVGGRLGRGLGVRGTAFAARCGIMKLLGGSSAPFFSARQLGSRGNEAVRNSFTLAEHSLSRSPPSLGHAEFGSRSAAPRPSVWRILQSYLLSRIEILAAAQIRMCEMVIPCRK